MTLATATPPAAPKVPPAEAGDTARTRAARDRWVPRLVALGICAAVVLAVLTLRASGALQPAELKVYDWLLRAARRPAPTTPLVVVGITERDIQSGSFGYPVTDGQLLDLLRRIVALQPRAIGIDIFRDIPVPLADEQGRVPRPHEDLIAFLQANDNIICVCEYAGGDGRGGPQVRPPEKLDATQIGLADLPPDRDGVVRRGLIVEGHADPATGQVRQYWSMAYQLASVYLFATDPSLTIGPAPGAADPKDFLVGRTVWPHFTGNRGGYAGADAGGVQFLADYRSPPAPAISAGRVLRDEVSPDEIRGKVVLVGMTAESVKDYLTMPVTGRTFGVFVQAAMADQLLRGALAGARPTRAPRHATEAAWIAAWGLLGGLAGLRICSSPWRLAAAAAVVVVVLAAVAWAAFARGWWVATVPAAATWLPAAALVTSYVSYRERADRLLLMQLFSRHVARPVAERIWEQRQDFLEAQGRLRAQELTATVLFTDLKGFTGVSERLGAAQLMAWLNDLMEELSACVEANGGMVGKYIGDSVMAMFGVPIPSRTEEEIRRDAANAVRCALDMRRRLAALNARWVAQGLPEIRMRVGIYTGELVAGSLGSRQRLEYTVIGETVNVASRLESYDKDLMDEDITRGGCRILLGGPTEALVRGLFKTRSLGNAKLYGMHMKEIGIHGVIE